MPRSKRPAASSATWCRCPCSSPTCATATASPRSDAKYSATISPAAPSSPSPPWPYPKPRSKFRATPSSAASSCSEMDNWLRYKCAIAAGATAAAFGGPAAPVPEDYPTGPIRLGVVTAAGGLMDVAARVTAEYVGKALGQSIVIENRPGGGGNLGAEAIAKAPPDGYTIGLIQLGNVAINPHIYAD